MTKIKEKSDKSAPSKGFHFDYAASLKILNYFQQQIHATTREHTYRLKQGHHNTLSFVLYAYCRQVKQHYGYSEYRHFQHLPPFITSCKGLTAHFKHGSTGTIYAHRERLIHTGALVHFIAGPDRDRQQWHLNPLFFLEAEEGKKEVDKLVEKLSERSGNPQEAKNQNTLKIALNATFSSIFEHLDTGALKETTDSPVNSVDKSPPDNAKEVGSPTGMKAGACRSRLQEQREKGKAAGEKKEERAAKNVEDKGRKEPERTLVAAQARAEVPRRSANFPPFLLALVVRFWAFAKVKLYPDTTFTPEQERTILNALYYTEFNLHTFRLTPAQWQERYETLLQRVVIAQRYVEKHSLYLPRAEYYFSGRDPDNPHAFKFDRTQEFVAKAVHDKIKREIKQWQRGKGRYRDHSASDLRRIHVARILTLDNHKYNQIYLNQTFYCYVKKASRQR